MRAVTGMSPEDRLGTTMLMILEKQFKYHQMRKEKKFITHEPRGDGVDYSTKE